MSSSAINNARKALRSFQTEERHFNDYMKKSIRLNNVNIDVSVMSRKSKDLNDLSADCKNGNRSCKQAYSVGS